VGNARAKSNQVPREERGRTRDPRDPRRALGRVPGGAAHPAPAPERLTDSDRLMYDRVRLGILSALAVNDTLTFSELKRLLAATDGNLSVHARKLENAGLVTCTKSFQDRLPKTEYRLTAAGRRSLEKFLNHMEALIRTTREG
jgi:DNA-binding HxlR family transcriptional regulator